MKAGFHHPLYHQLPAWSPLPFSALIRGARALLPTGRDPRDTLLQLLMERTGTEEGILTDSGTSALRIALGLMKEEGRTPVALPAFSCFDVATAAVGADVPALLYDLDPETLSPDLPSLEGALSAGARSVVIAPLYGFPVDWEGIRGLTDPAEAIVIEDAAQAHGSRFQGKPWGSHGDLVVLSFGRGKGWSGGGGGALLCRESRWANRPRIEGSLRRHGTLPDLRWATVNLLVWVLARPSVYGIPRRIPALGLGETHYREPRPAAAMGPAAAATAVGTLAAAQCEIHSRSEAADHYSELVAGLDPSGATLRPARPVEDGEAGWLRFPVAVVGAGLTRDEVLNTGGRRLGAEASYPEPLGQVPPLASHLVRTSQDCSGADALAVDLLTLPTHSRTTAGERDRLIRLLTTGRV